jgi:uncharacterized protein (UPF0548 family)
MFSFRRPSEASIRQSLATARELPLNYGFAFKTEGNSDLPVIPHGYERDHTRSEIGHGALAFQAAREAFRQWKHFDLGWVRVANPEARIEVEEMVAVEAHVLGLWSVNYSRILYVIDEIDQFGFGYGTTAQHVERGEERFLLEFYPVSGVVAYDLLAISSPAHWLARIGYPYTRNRQKRFAAASHRHMRKLLAGDDPLSLESAR